MNNRHKARLIPVGKSSEAEAEQRATSALLAVLSIVRPFSQKLLTPLGASNAEKAQLGTFIEHPFKHPSGRTVRPDGLIEVRHGKGKLFTALVEVKTGAAKLEAQQIRDYLDVAREQKYDCVLTISNEIATAPNVHPTVGLKLRSSAKVKLHHLSWTRILSEVAKVRFDHGVKDVEQAWILEELERYLAHPTSGVMELDDMGVSWTAVRDGAREGTLQQKNKDVLAIAQTWNQLLQFVALNLGSKIGGDVLELIPKAQQADPTLRTREFVESLCDGGTLSGNLRIKNTMGDLELTADLRARQITTSVYFNAPTDRGARARVSWLLRRLGDSPKNLTIEAFAKNSRTPVVASLEATIEDPSMLLGPDKREPIKFRVILRRELGVNRKSGRGKGFVESVNDSVQSFYTNTLQPLGTWLATPTKIQPADTPSTPPQTSPRSAAA